MVIFYSYVYVNVYQRVPKVTEHIWLTTTRTQVHSCSVGGIPTNYGSESSQNYRVLCVCVVTQLWCLVLSTKSGHDWDSKVRQCAHTNERRLARNDIGLPWIT
jgi:hypothetical protein